MSYTRNVYLDHAATTPTDGTVIAKMKHCMTEAWNNPSAVYSAAGLARKEMRLARQAVGELIGARPEELVFTSGGTEANASAMWQARGKHIILSATEHASVIENAKHFSSEITIIPPDSNGIISPASVIKALKPDTAMVSIHYANNETGVIQPVTEIADALKGTGCLFHSDAVQAAGHVPLDAETSGIHFLTLSAHKLYGPRGTGCLYIRRGISAVPLLAGGGQEKNLRSGTENIPAIAGFGLAAKLAKADLSARLQRETMLREQLENGLRHLLPSLRILGENQRRVPGISAIFLPGISAEWLIAQLDLAGIQISGGAACASRSGKPSHVYTAMGLTEKEAAQTVRFSLGRHTTPDEIQYVLNKLEQILNIC